MQFRVYLAVAAFLFMAGCKSSDNPASPATQRASQQFIFVNPLTGSDNGPGSADAPVKSIHKAFSMFQPGTRIELEAGTYDAANGQIFPDSLPSGVVVESLSALLAVLLGTSSDVAFYGSGTDTLKYLQFQGFNTCVRAGAGVHVFVGTGFNAINKAFDLYGAAEGQWKGGTGINAVIAVAGGSSRINITNCIVTGTSTNSIVQLNNAAFASIEGALVKDAPTTVLDLNDASTAIVNNCTFTNTGLHNQGSTAAASLRGTATLALVGTSIAQTFGPAISMESQNAVLSVERSFFDQNGSGSNGAGLYLSGTATIDSSTISNSSKNGIVLSGGSFEIYHSSISGASSTGIYLSGGSSLLLRNTSITYTGDGVLLAASTSIADLGTSTDPGGNTFQYNTRFGLESDVTSQASAIPAAGNTWTPSVQGADANGHYASQTVNGPTSSTTPLNYYITSAGRGIRF